MRSKTTDHENDVWDVDFGRDVPTTAADVEALLKARQLRPLTFAQYVEWVTSIVGDKRPASRETNRDTDKPFEL